MLKRLNEIEKMDNEDKVHILSVIDGFIKSIPTIRRCANTVIKPIEHTAC